MNWLENRALQNCVDSLLKEMGKHQDKLNGVEAAKPELQDSYDQAIKNLNENRGRPLFYPYVSSGLGRGCYVKLMDGSVKMDLINGIGPHILGHGHPLLLKASVEGALSDVVFQGALQGNEDLIKFTDKVIHLASRKSSLKHGWLTTSGSMANENALKICRQKRNKARKILAMKEAFAGRTVMMSEVTDSPAVKTGLPSYEEVLRIPFYNEKDPKSCEKSLSVLKEHIEREGSDICSFIFETIQGEGGFQTAPREFFVPLLEVCRKEGIPIWVDEIQTFGRTGRFFGFETLDIGEYLDICTVAKALQSGITLFTDEMRPKGTILGGTFQGCSSALRAGLAVLEFLEKENIMGPEGRALQIEKEFKTTLKNLSCSEYITNITGMGLMLAFQIFDGSSEKRNNFLKVLYKNGVVGFGCGHDPCRVRFLLPAIMTSEDIKVASVLIEKSIKEMC